MWILSSKRMCQGLGDWLVDQTTCFVIVCLSCVVAVRTGDSDTERVYDQSFGNKTGIAGRVVTCDKHTPRRYPGESWTCNNMKIDGRRLRFSTIPGFSAGQHCGENHEVGSHKEYRGRNDFAALCRDLMNSNGIGRQLWAAMVTEASCNSTTDQRLMYRKKKDRYIWEDFREGKGFAVTLRCMAMP